MWQPGWEGSLGENGCMTMYDWVPSLFAWNYHSMVNQLYPIQNKKLKKISVRIWGGGVIDWMAGVDMYTLLFSPLSCVWLFRTLWTAACQAPLSFTTSQSLIKLMSIELVMLSNHLIPCYSLLLLPSIFPSIRVFSSDSVLRIRWPKYSSFSFNTVLLMNILDWSPWGKTSWISL